MPDCLSGSLCYKASQVLWFRPNFNIFCLPCDCHDTPFVRCSLLVGFSSAADRQQLKAIINRAIRWCYYKKTDPSLNKACSIRERNLFLSVLQNPSHVLHHLLPPVKPHHYNLRSRPHNRILPAKTHPLMKKNFLSRMLYLPSLIPS